MLIVEGPDGAGKTTLVKKLSEDLALPVAPRVVSKDTEALVDLREWTDRNLEAGFQSCIYDRHRLISEFIYGPIIRRSFYQGFEDNTWLMQSLMKLYNIEPLVVFCLPPIEAVWDNIRKDDDNQTVRDHIRPIYWAYWGAAAQWEARDFWHTWRWDYTAEDRKYWGLQRSLQAGLEGRGIR